MNCMLCEKPLELAITTEQGFICPACFIARNGEKLSSLPEQTRQKIIGLAGNLRGEHEELLEDRPTSLAEAEPPPAYRPKPKNTNNPRKIKLYAVFYVKNYAKIVEKLESYYGHYVSIICPHLVLDVRKASDYYVVVVSGYVDSQEEFERFLENIVERRPNTVTHTPPSRELQIVKTMHFGYIPLHEYF